MFDSGIPEALTRDQLLQLIKQKENLEKEIKALHDVLKSQNVGKLKPYTHKTKYSGLIIG